MVPTLTFNGNLLGSSKLVHYGFKLLLFGLIWFSFLYFLIKDLRENCKGYKIFHQSKWFYFWIWFACYSVMLVTEVVMYSLGLGGNTFAMDNFSTIRDMQSFPCVLGAAAFFLMFKKSTSFITKKSILWQQQHLVFICYIHMKQVFRHFGKNFFVWIIYRYRGTMSHIACFCYY